MSWVCGVGNVSWVCGNGRNICVSGDASSRVLVHRYPGKKEEQWWLVVGDPKSNTLFTVRRFTLQRHQTIKLKITAPSKVGKHNLMLYYMSDSYMGCDQVPFMQNSKPQLFSPVEDEQT